MSKILQTIQNIFKIEELKDRILFTLGILIVVRIGAHITLPGVDVTVLKMMIANQDSNTLFGLFDLFVGGAFSNAAIFALGIMPYITASIIFQLAGVVVPEIQKIQKDGEDGRRKINQYTRILTVFIAALQGWGISIKLANDNVGGIPVVPEAGFLFSLTTIVLLAGGTVFMMWLGEQITERGIGNGISLIIMIGIIAQLPVALMNEWNLVMTGSRLWPVELVVLALLVVIIAAIVLVTQGARRIPVQYAKRQVGNKVFGGTTQYIPLRVNTAGVMPIIFAQSLMFIPNTVATFFPESPFFNTVARLFDFQSFFYAGIYFIMIVFFTYFYTAIIFNPKDIADNMKKQGGFIPGIRPGNNTSEYIESILTRITLPGSVFLGIVAVMPTFVTYFFKVDMLFASFFGGTSLLIMVGVALDTLQQIESHLLMRHYDGFMKSGKIRGRTGVGGF
ncbi:MAG: preprotein translocase subunit SecY [Candidatus Kapabacteria bacterium]|nr:preprotein translocase subunit SecY [Ignavibacteriota bacterium]MCW5884040.1 preprotein translocase subunit SecY [Candidatus Kapabacteria bacterium]